jgi:hypothetical protein
LETKYVNDFPAIEQPVTAEQGIAAPSAGPTWQEQDGVLRDLWLKNQPPQAIAEALGRSIPAIMTRAARLGLPRRAAPGRKPGVRRTEGMSAERTTVRAATQAQQAAVAVQTSLRVCLMCLNKFESLGKHNRICSTCKGSSEYESASSLSELHIQV